MGLVFEGNTLNKNRGTFGFNMGVDCNYPEANLTNSILFKDNMFFMDAEGPFVMPTNNFINYHGPGNISFINNTWRVYHDSIL